MAKEIRTMKVSKTTEAEINKMQQFFNEIEWYVKEHLSIEDIDFEQYEVFKTFGKLNDESNEQDYRDFIHNLLSYADDLGAFRLLCNTTTMLANCADPNCDVLEFNPEIKAALQLAEEMKGEEDLYYIATNEFVGNNIVWWGKNNNGYTAKLQQAGKYTAEEAASICTGGHREPKAYTVKYVHSCMNWGVDAQNFDRSKVVDTGKIPANH